MHDGECVSLIRINFVFWTAFRRNRVNGQIFVTAVPARRMYYCRSRSFMATFPRPSPLIRDSERRCVAVLLRLSGQRSPVSNDMQTVDVPLTQGELACARPPVAQFRWSGGEATGGVRIHRTVSPSIIVRSPKAMRVPSRPVPSYRTIEPAFGAVRPRKRNDLNDGFLKITQVRAANALRPFLAHPCHSAFDWCFLGTGPSRYAGNPPIPVTSPGSAADPVQGSLRLVGNARQDATAESAANCPTNQGKSDSWAQRFHRIKVRIRRRNQSGNVGHAGQTGGKNFEKRSGILSTPKRQDYSACVRENSFSSEFISSIHRFIRAIVACVVLSETSVPVRISPDSSILSWRWSVPRISIHSSIRCLISVMRLPPLIVDSI